MNLATAAYAALVNYQGNLKGSLAELEARLNAFEAGQGVAMLDIAFEREIADIAAIRQGPEGILLDSRVGRLELDREEFRLRVAEAVWASDERIAASIGRLDEAIARQKTSDVRRVLSMIIVVTEIWSDMVKLGEAISEATSADDVGRILTPAQQEVQPADDAADVGAAEGEIGTESAAGGAQAQRFGPFDEAEALARELLALPAPSEHRGDPTTATLTPHEEIAGRLLPLLEVWSDSEADTFAARYEAAREDMGETLVGAAVSGDVGTFAMALLSNVVLPSNTGSGADSDSVLHRDAIMRRIEPVLNEMVRWRLGETLQ